MAPGLVTAEKAARGKLPTDVWWHTIVPTNGAEKTGYATQKPEGIVRRMVLASTRPGDWCLDFFAGSGTLGAVAAKLGRRYVLVDSNPDAVATMHARLARSRARARRSDLVSTPMDDIGAVFDEHVAAEFVRLDLDATMATMTDEPYVNHVPVMTGGVGAEEVRQFYGRHFIGKWPKDIEITPVSRTVGDNQVVDELVLSFTHDIAMDQLLPGVTADRQARPGRVLRRGRGSRTASSRTSTSTGTRRRSSSRSGLLDRSESSRHRRRAGGGRPRSAVATAEPADTTPQLTRAVPMSCTASLVASRVTARTELPTGTVTFLFTDIEGSTRLLHALGAGGVRGCAGRAPPRAARGVRRATAGSRWTRRATPSSSRSRPRPARAAAASPATKRSTGGPIRVRMGLHTGTPTPTGEGYVGSDVHRGARVAALAHGGQIVLSPATAALLEASRSAISDFTGSRTSRARRGSFSSAPTTFPRSGRPAASSSPHQRRRSSAASGSSSTPCRSSSSATRAC